EVTLTVTANDGRYFLRWSDGNTDNPRKYTITEPNTTVTLTAECPVIPPYNSVDGAFTISAEGKQVKFAAGNLRCTIHGTDTTWVFADHQYDFIGAANVANGALASTIDLFGWSGSTAATMWGISISGSNGDYSGDFADWGLNIGDGTTWRTLSHEEFNYLCRSRANATNLIGVARINLDEAGTTYANGLILLPDTWTCPQGITFKPGFSENVGSQAYADYQTFSLEQWSALEAAGAVFMPTTGYREYGGVQYVQDIANYWSSSIVSEDMAFAFFIGSYTIQPYNSHMRRFGMPVRLVNDIKPEVGMSFVQGEYKYTIISLDPEDLQVEVAKGSDDFAVTNIVIPKKVNQWGYTFAVTAIAWSGFQDCCNAPTTVTLPATLRRIVNYAFADNEGLGPNLVIPEGVTEIGQCAFRNGTGLREVVLPSTLQSISEGAFESCWNISSITMNTTTPPACGNLFYDVPVTGKALYVPYDAYDTYTNTDYWKNFAVKSIAPIGTLFFVRDYASYCEYSYEVTAHAPYEVSIRCEEPFFAMDDLTLPSSVSHRGIDYTLTGIADRGFADARHIFHLYLPESITRIGERAFENCYWLQELTIPSTVTHIGEQILSGCTNLRRFEYRGVPDNESLWMDLCSMPQLETLITPAHTLSLTGKALRLSLLTGEHAEHSSNLRYVEITGGNINSNTLYCLSHFRNLTTLDMRLADCSTLPAEGLRNSYSLQTLILPEGLTTIDYMAVADCKYLTTIDIPAGVERIADGAFENCRSLNTIHFLGTEVLTHIGNWAFYQCHELRNLTIPEGVTSIGLAAFYGCTYLQDLVLPASLENIEDNGFALCGQLRAMRVHAAEPPSVSSKTFESVSRSIPVTVPDAAVSAYKAAPVWQEFNIVGETNAPTGLSESLSDQQGVQKILRNGQVLILRNGDTYDMMGQKQ
ncbi:MAG: leucine-rich repeat protein, partial [Paludibacteraceae bacterium]